MTRPCFRRQIQSSARKSEQAQTATKPGPFWLKSSSKARMHLAELEPAAPDRVDLGNKRLLIFIVAYNAQTTIEKVLSRIPRSLENENVEVLIIDDSSKDDTFLNGLRYQRRNSAFKITILRTPENQGYGGNQK